MSYSRPNSARVCAKVSVASSSAALPTVVPAATIGAPLRSYVACCRVARPANRSDRPALEVTPAALVAVARRRSASTTTTLCPSACRRSAAARVTVEASSLARLGASSTVRRPSLGGMNERLRPSTASSSPPPCAVDPFLGITPSIDESVTSARSATSPILVLARARTSSTSRARTRPPSTPISALRLAEGALSATWVVMTEEFATDSAGLPSTSGADFLTCSCRESVIALTTAVARSLSESMKLTETIIGAVLMTTACCRVAPSICGETDWPTSSSREADLA